MFYKDNQLFTESEIKALYPNTSFPIPFKADGYELVFDTPSPTVTELQVAYQDGTEIDSKGNRVVKWGIKNKFDTAEEEQVYIEQLQAEAISNAVAKYEKLVTDYIQGKVNDYNKANGLAFKDIDAFTKYALIPTSLHNAIALQFITYADNVWGAMRAYQSTLTTIPSDEEVMAVLDSVVF